MKDKIFSEIDRLKDSMIFDLINLVKIPSKRGEVKEGAPYGDACKEALEKALEICKREGFDTKNVDGYMAYGSYGKSEEYLGIFGHLDVVEEGTGWEYPPYSAKIVDNIMYSRGVLDNKGPTIAALYGLIALKNLGIKPKREIRMVFGTNEETGMKDIEYYLSHEKEPLFGFVPDNKFPAIYGERGRANIEFTGNEDKLLEFINSYFINSDSNGKKLGVYVKDELFGEMIVRNKIVFKRDGNLVASLQLSTPQCKIEDIMENLGDKFVDLKITLINWTEWALKNPDSTNVTVLNKVYNEFMNTDIKPTTTTGMTYAHKCKSIIPFGPSFPGQNGISHLPNEFMDINDLVNMAKIYAYGLYKLNEVEEVIR